MSDVILWHFKDLSNRFRDALHTHLAYVRTYQGIFSLSRSCKTGSHNRLGQTRSFEILKIYPTVSEILCTRTLRTCGVREYIPCVCNESRKQLDESLKFQRISSDLVYCGNPSCKTDSRKNPFWYLVGPCPSTWNLVFVGFFFAPNQKVQKRKYVFIGPINTTALVQSPNFYIVTLSPPSITGRKSRRIFSLQFGTIPSGGGGGGGGGGVLFWCSVMVQQI